MGIKMVSQILSEEIKPIDWLVKDLIPEKGITILGGDVGSLKTYFSIYLGLCCVSGKKVLDIFEAKKIKVLYIDEENRERTIKDRLKKLLKGLNIKEENLQMGFLISSGMKLDKIKKGGKLEKMIINFKPNLIIVDSMVRVFDGEENSSSDVKKIFDKIKPLIEHDTSWLLLHHTRKTNTIKVKDDLRGSSDFGAFADIILMINKVEKNAYTLNQPKNRLQQATEPIKINVVDTNDGGLKIIYSGEGIKKASMSINERCAESIIERIKKENLKSFKTKDIEKVLDYKHNAINNGLSFLVIKGVLKHISKGYWEVIT